MPPEQYLGWGVLNEMLSFLAGLTRNRCSIMALGKIGSGKTTLLNALSHYISPRDRVVTSLTPGLPTLRPPLAGCVLSAYPLRRAATQAHALCILPQFD